MFMTSTPRGLITLLGWQVSHVQPVKLGALRSSSHTSYPLYVWTSTSSPIRALLDPTRPTCASDEHLLHFSTMQPVNMRCPGWSSHTASSM